jgi:hypothetical protein
LIMALFICRMTANRVFKRPRSAPACGSSGAERSSEDTSLSSGRPWPRAFVGFAIDRRNCLRERDLGRAHSTRAPTLPQLLFLIDSRSFQIRKILAAVRKEKYPTATRDQSSAATPRLTRREPHQAASHSGTSRNWSSVASNGRVGDRAGLGSGTSVGRPRCRRICWTTDAWSINATRRSRPPQRVQTRTSRPNVRRISSAH